MKNLFAAALPFIFIGAAYAQSPTITSANFVPTLGETFYGVNTTEPASGEGTAGANQVWNFGSIPNTGSLDPLQVIPVIGSLYEADYPTANLCTKSEPTVNLTAYSYYQTSGNDFILFREQVSGRQLTYTDNPIIAQFPLIYNSTYTDTYVATFPFNSGVRARTSGRVTSLVDGYGTLTTPIGTFTNVLRVKFIDIYSDSVSNWLLGNVDEIKYMYYKAGIHTPLLTFLHKRVNGAPTKRGSYLQSITVNTEEAQLALQLNMGVFPNPSASTAGSKIKLSLSEASECTVSLYDAIGMQVASQNMGELAAGEQILALPTTNELAKGIYFVRVQTKQGFATTKLTIN